MEQKVIVLMTSSFNEDAAQDYLQKKINKAMAEHKGWRVMSANTTMAVSVSLRHYTTTLVLERQAPPPPVVSTGLDP